MCIRHATANCLARLMHEAVVGNFKYEKLTLFLMLSLYSKL